VPGGKAMLTVFGRTNSSNVQKVLCCLDEIGVPFEREDVGGVFGRNRDLACRRHVMIGLS